MDGLWIALGVAILVVTFLDIFLAVLNYNEPGIIVNRLVRLQWILIRSITRRVSRRWRPLVLRQVTGILLLSTILWWILGVVLGFTLIYLGLIGLGAFQISQGVVPDFIGALYLSFGQFATVGADNISPAGGWVNLIPVLEALASVVLLSFIITFLSNIYGVIQFLRSLCADFFSTGPGVGNPVDALRPYFPNGTPRDIDRHLNELVDDFNLYCDSLRQDHAAYHFQSGEDQFSLPFALYMTSGVAGALRWGLPTGHDATLSPSLVRLTEVFDDFRELRYRRMRWAGPVVPDVVPVERFRQDLAEFSAHRAGAQTDPWVLKFLTLNAEMADVIGISVDADRGADEAYGRYVCWLEFAYPAQHFVTRVSRDLDYQPIYRGVSAAPEDLDQDRAGSTDAAAPAPARASHPARSARRTGGLIAWARRRHLFLDPGFVRLSTALRTLGAVVAAVAVATAVGAVLQVDPVPAGVFAALIAVFSVPMSSGWGPGLQRSTGLLALIPVAGGVAAGAFLPRDPVTAVIVLAVIAAAAVWVGRFGPRWAMWGQLGFIAYYFSLLLAVTPEELTAALIAAGIGVVSGWASNLLPRPRRDRQVRAGIRAVAERTSVLIDAAIDALAGGASRRLGRVLQAENAALRTSVTSLTALLDPDPSDGRAVGHALERRLHAFDVQLAAENLLRTLPEDADFAVTVDERSVLAGELAAVQQHADLLRRGNGAAAHASALPSAGDDAAHVSAMPAGARRVHDAILELSGAIVALLSEPIDASAAAPSFTTSTPPAASDPPGAAFRAPGRAAVHATDRRAVQVGLATGLALFLASFVSSTHQYWAALPAYQALTGSDGERLSRTMQRLVGTVIGAAGAFGLALMTGHDSIVAFAVVVVSVFFMSFLRAVASSWTAFWQTVLLATMYDLLAQLDAEAIHVRIVETTIGAAVALLVAALVLPTRTRARVLEGMAALVGTASTITHTALVRLGDPPSVASIAQAGTLAGLEVTMQSQLDEVLSHAGAQRRDPGALQHSGIETQLTSLTALAFYAQRLAAAAEKGDQPPDAAVWSRLDAATRDNFASTIAVLDGRLPARVHDLREFTSPIGRPGDGAPIATVERINETLLTYMSAVQPGSTDAGSNSA